MRGTEFAELSAFVAVAERKNFGRAAAYLGIVPSTLSQTIRSLEERLGVGLLQRTTRSVSVTEAGERLLARIRPAFDELQGAVESLNDFRDTPTGTLRISASTVPAQLILAPLLKGFTAAYPAITVEIAIDDTTSDIISGHFDAGLRYGRRIGQDMVTVRVSDHSRLIAMASPEYLEKHGTPKSPEDLHDHACIRFRSDTQQIIPWEFQRNKKKVEIAVNGPLIVNNAELMVKAALDGIGIGYMFEYYMAEDLKKGNLIALLDDWSPRTHCHYLYYASRRQLPVPLRVFIDFLRKNARNRTAGAHSA